MKIIKKNLKNKIIIKLFFFLEIHFIFSLYICLYISFNFYIIIKLLKIIELGCIQDNLLYLIYFYIWMIYSSATCERHVANDNVNDDNILQIIISNAFLANLIILIILFNYFNEDNYWQDHIFTIINWISYSTQYMT